MSPTGGVLCVIPARGGSKRVPRKNVRPVDGVPMIRRTLDRVISSGLVDHIVVSTDDDEIAAISEAAGASVPFRRPKHLADDHTPTAPVIAHAISTIDVAGRFPYTVAIYPTSVFLEAADLRRGRDAVVQTDRQLAMSVCRYSAPTERAWTLHDDGTGSMRHPEHALTRTQDLEAAYFDAGQFYFGTSQFWIDGGDIARARPYLVELPVSRAIDIDTEQDLDFADLLARASRIDP